MFSNIRYPNPFLLSLVAIQSVPVIAQGIVAANPSFDCSNTNFQVIYSACTAGDYTKCCPLGADCCAGGCCDILSSCINIGTANEGCCPVTSPDVCGLYPVGGNGTGTAPSLPEPSVVCTGLSGLSSYFCPPGSTCDIDRAACFLPSSSVGGASSTPVPIALPSSSVSSLAATSPPLSSTSPSPGSSSSVSSPAAVSSQASSSSSSLSSPMAESQSPSPPSSSSPLHTSIAATTVFVTPSAASPTEPAASRTGAAAPNAKATPFLESLWGCGILAMAMFHVL